MLSSMRKNPLEKKPYPPGEHGRGRQRQTEYGMRLLEKQKARWYYGVSEKQFRRAYDRATRMQGVSGENLLRIMELRMDNVVYRMGFATSRPQAQHPLSHPETGRRYNREGEEPEPGSDCGRRGERRGRPGVARGRPRELHGQGAPLPEQGRDRHARRRAAHNRILQPVGG